MAASQIPALWPSLFRINAQPVIKRTSDAAIRQAARAPRRTAYHSTRSLRRPEHVKQRYGIANEPPPHLSGVKATQTSQNPEKSSSKPGNEQLKEQPRVQQQAATPESIQKQDGRDTAKDTKATQTAAPIGDKFQSEDEKKLAGEALETSTPAATESPQDTSISAKAQSTLAEMSEPLHDESNALTKILNMEPPMADDANVEDKPRHLQAPRYVHHFDTYTLVNSLVEGGFTEDQAVDVMKSVRGMLAANMDLARDGLVSQADSEMESYLFRAACSELRTEIRQRRQSNSQQMSSSRIGLQHEVDTLSQRITQESMSLKDELKGMFDDRKMAVQLERREMENKIQELNYKITVALNSEMRSEVEGLRWVMTRRTVIALLAIVVMSLATLRYAKFAEQQQEMERKKWEQQAKQLAGIKDLEAVSDDVRRRIEAGEDASLVSLG